ncbi:YbbR-like domain-containing protein [Alteribacillus sp. HJP-4]|uniref:CdaR family protein n=1 Tax=Alteribacillus sp. HJP-4 TaxID=2775394 RepID=UPI0035CCEBA1
MDRLFNNHWFVKFVSLCVAVMLYIMVNMNNVSNQPGVIPNNDESSYTLEDVELRAEVNDEQYAVVDMPETVDVEVTGTQTSIMLFQLSRSNYEVYVDLQEMGEGTHNVRVDHQNFPADLNVVISPRTVSVTIEELESRDYPVDVELTNEDQAEDGYTFGDPSTDPEQVTVIAAPSQHRRIENLRAYVDVSGANGDVEGESQVVAYDAYGEEMNITADPEIVNVHVPADSPSAEVPINLSREGSLPDNLSIESLDIEPTEVTIFGPMEILEEIDTVEAVLDLSEIEGNGTIEINPELPEGVERIRPETLEVEVEVADREEAAFESIPIEIENMPEDHEFDFANPEDGQANVTLFGAANVLDGLTQDDIALSAEWQEDEDGGGRTTLPISAAGPSNVRIEPDINEVEIEYQQNAAEENDENEEPDETPEEPAEEEEDRQDEQEQEPPPEEETSE